MSAYYSISIIFRDDTVTRKHDIRNMTGKELMSFREMIYSVGLFIPDKDCPVTEGEIISPYNIIKIEVFMHNKKKE